jgi:uncharacterized protein (DUF1810 family)
MRADNDLERFVDAQAPVYESVRAELRAGCKRSHWMWFVFPQLRSLGHSSTAHYYGIASSAEAKAYFAHGLLGARLRECVELVLAVEGKTAHDIFGSPDDLKFRSSMTLFAHVAPDERLFSRALDHYYDGSPDPLTLDRLSRA